ncbi:hypothetical protein [Azospirillum canadense]|uniref:hypothetical protein n=1 Tax=Azospirillum canadense TaxID=403962 RepID=UPI0022270DF2|nr:hypothetical protein [Azospirillum canadense]MCW2241599.1 hypothetical protein [Azospirillum canadense]
MRPAHLLAPALYSYRKLGGALSFSVFDEFDGSDARLREALAYAINEACGGRDFINLERIAQLSGREISREDFLAFSMSDPLDWRPERVFGRFGLALALSYSQYRPGSPGSEKLFDEMVEAVSPSSRDRHFWDWKTWDLPSISPYFTSDYLGRMEWWNVYLLTVHVPAEERLFVIVGSFDYYDYEVPLYP